MSDGVMVAKSASERQSDVHRDYEASFAVRDLQVLALNVQLVEVKM